MRTCITKELKALVAAWALVLSAVITAGFTEGGLLVPVIAAVGMVGLGAWSIGHEYSHRTLPLLLSQPVGRPTIALTKAMSVTPLLVTVSAAAMALSRDASGPIMIGTAFAAALSLAPWLTMLSRSARGGIFFTFALGLLWVMVGIRAGEAIAVREPGRWADPLGFADYFVYGGFAVMFCVAGVLGWRRFQSLSALDERSEHLALPVFGLGRHRAKAMTSRVRHPLVALLRKELGLQMPVFMLSTVYLLAWVGGWFLRPSARETLLMVVTMLHGGLVPLLAGALASAEERRFGTRATQLLQPVSARVQWTVKAVVVVGLAVVLALGLPAALDLFDPAVLSERGVRRLEIGWSIRTLLPVVAVVGMLAGLALYVSSLAGNSLHALLGSIAASAALSIGLDAGLRSAYWRGWHQAAVLEVLTERRELIRTPEVWGALSEYWRDSTHANEILNWGAAFILVAGGLWLFLRFGYENHRFDDQRLWRIGVQVGALLLVPVVALGLYGLLPWWIVGG
ncbi:MAG TPA: hypothetical protein VLA20_09935 [Vicinamibacterales bacterium]|nr:hypothetical protein [Vicinamibacterales bacterium]